jgi:acyl-CoA thioesterase
MNKSTGPHQFQMKEWISGAPFERLLSMNIVEASDGKATLTMPFFIDYAQGAGLMHGGALVSLADTAVVMAIKTILPPHTHFGTVSLESKFIRPVKQGTVTAEARIVSQEGRTLRGEAVVYDEAGRAVLKFSSVFKIAKDTRIRGVSFNDNPKPGD